MKQLLIFLLSIVTLSAFGQAGSQSISVLRSRVNDSTTVNGAHALGYGDIYFNNQRAQPALLWWDAATSTYRRFGSGTVTSVGLTAGTTGTDVNISGSPITSSGNITLNIPDASASNRGVVTTVSQTIAGAKTFTSDVRTTVDAGTNGVVVSATSGLINLTTSGVTAPIGLSTTGNFIYSTKAWQSPGFTFTTSGNSPDTQASVLTGTLGVTQHRNRFGISSSSGFSFLTNTASSYSVSGEQYNMVHISNSDRSYNISSGTGTFRSLLINPTINTTGGASTVYGIYYNPTETSLTGVTNYGIVSSSVSALSGFGMSTPTAKLHIGSGTTAIAPLKLTSGTNLTTPEAGAIEFDGTNYFATTSTTRHTIAKTLTATGALNFDLTAVNSQDLTITVTGANDGDAVSIGVPNVSATANVIYTAWTSGANTVTIRVSRIDVASGADPASGTFRAAVLKY